MLYSHPCKWPGSTSHSHRFQLLVRSSNFCSSWLWKGNQIPNLRSPRHSFTITCTNMCLLDSIKSFLQRILQDTLNFFSHIYVVFIIDRLIRNWESLNEGDSQRVWSHFDGLLREQGVYLFGSESYSNTPLPPNKVPADSFHPLEHEDFVHRLRRPSKLDHWRPEVNNKAQSSTVAKSKPM